MNPKIPVLGVIGGLALVILVIAYSGTSIEYSDEEEQHEGRQSYSDEDEQQLVVLKEVLVFMVA